MFFRRKKSLKEIKEAILKLKGAIRLSNEMIIDSCYADTQHRIAKKDYEHAINLGVYLLSCVSAVNIFGVIKDEAIRNEVLRHFIESLLDLSSAQEFGFEEGNYHIFASMYQAMFSRCNIKHTGNAAEFFADICANFISNDLQMSYSSEQIKYLSKLIGTCNKSIYGEVVAESMNLNL